MNKEYGLWPEASGRVAAGLKNAKRVTVGIDVGTTSAQAAILSDGVLFAWASIRTGWDFRKTAKAVFSQALEIASLTESDVESIAATGFGAKNADCAKQTIDEISCHAKGARFMFGPSVRTIVDMGGQNTNVISLYEWGRVRAFRVNDKCATGMGRHIEAVCELLHVPICEMGKLSLENVIEPEPVSTTCCNFAYPETVGLLRQGYKEESYTKSDVLAAYLFAVEWRILGTIGKLAPLDIGNIVLEHEIAFTGGLAKNVGITERLNKDLKMKALQSEYDPQLAGAIGAALLA
jgi:predicted CoA-substrate-specific enzyme activase